MQLPAALRDRIEQLCSSLRVSDLQKATEVVTSQYRARKTSSDLFHDPVLLRSYLATRVPATFAACREVLRQLDLAPRSLLDLGAGPGTASWAAKDVFDGIEQFYLFEKEPKAIAIGKELAKDTFLEKAVWRQGDITSGLELPRTDLAVLSYLIAEVGVKAVPWDALFSACSVLVIIEPGTPDGYGRILQARDTLIQMGGFVIAPCPHMLKCPMVGSDWCHFAARVERSRLHRQLKEGSLGFEDEKFSYLVVAKSPGLSKDRVIDPPENGHGFVKLRLCTKEGVLERKTISKKDREAYRSAKKMSWGSPM